ncbi:hypothetical protein TREMEDRAFT_20116, partial [Tremella mesenterica DSM 1558]|uniref:uncharacterized protein n=1 Tax=Tremella mesenterica (strain ATCC 24925 / CBS 8224 / DSM 1558 / NBRC 9311 / NRRL Y-6157 / RJB 2259-6 / UBC 559-6) TaxID=578456 RepID=UPI0003F4A23A
MGSCNIMGNFPTLKILRGEDKIKIYEEGLSNGDEKIVNWWKINADHPFRVYKACMEFDKDDNCIESSTSKRSFCEECSSMLWNYHDDWPHV